jgi:hypothetical protein
MVLSDGLMVASGRVARELIANLIPDLRHYNLKLFYRQKHDVRITCSPDTYAGLGNIHQNQNICSASNICPFRRGRH